MTQPEPLTEPTSTRQTSLSKRQDKERQRELKATTKVVRDSMSAATSDGFARIAAISDEEWQRAVDEDEASQVVEIGEARRTREEIVAEFSKVGQLAYMMAEMDESDSQYLSATWFRQMVTAFESEVSKQAEASGCPGYRRRLVNNGILTVLGDLARSTAESVVSTYNRDLAFAIEAIRSETPTANRYTYASRLRKWSTKRSGWKDPQVAQQIEGQARAMAQQEFYARNLRKTGYAILRPRTAVCPVCQGWINRKWVPLQTALNAPPPYHVNCPHKWDTRPNQVPPGGCRDLWMGE